MADKNPLGFWWIVLIAMIEESAILAVYIYDQTLLRLGALVSSFFLIISVNICWAQLPEGKVSKYFQFLHFTIIPILVFVPIQILSISNWWCILFTIIYICVLSAKYDIKTDDDRPSSNSEMKKIFINSLFRTIRKK